MVAAEPGARSGPQFESKFPARDRSAVELIDSDYRPFLLRRLRRHAPDLPDDLHEDIVQELLSDLWELGAETFDRSRGSMKAYLTQRVRKAVRRVRAQYAAPGERTRRRRAASALTPAAVTYTAPLQFQRSAAAEAVGVSAPDDDAEDMAGIVETSQLEAEIDAERVMMRARRGGRLHEALRRIYWHDESMVLVARTMSVPRTTLCSAIGQFFETERAAQVA